MWTESARRSAEAIRSAKRPPLAPGEPAEPVISGTLSRVAVESLGAAGPMAVAIALLIWGLARGPVDASLSQVALLVGVVGLAASVVVWSERRYGMEFGAVNPWPEQARPGSHLAAAGWGALPRLFIPFISLNLAFSDSFDWAWRGSWLTFLVVLTAADLWLSVRAFRAERQLGVRIYAERVSRRAGWKRPPVFALER